MSQNRPFYTTLDSILKERPSAAIVVTAKFNHLSQICQRFNLRKTVLAPTRGSNTLDQLLTNISKLYNKVLHLADPTTYTIKSRKSKQGNSKISEKFTPENIRALGLALNLENCKLGGCL